MDTRADPCSDFVTYSCGSWQKKTGIPPASPGIVSEPFDTIAKDNMRVLQYVADHLTHEQDPLLHAFFKSCSNLDKRIETSYAYLQDQLFPEFAPSTFSDSASFLKQVHRAFVSSPFWDLEMQNNELKDATMNFLNLDGTGTTESYINWKNTTDRQAYTSYVRATLEQVGGDGAQAEGVVAFEYELDKLDPYGDNSYRNLSLSDLHQLAPSWDWRALLAGEGVDVGAENFGVMTWSSEYIAGLARILNETIAAGNKAALSAYAQYHLFLQLGPFMPPGMQPHLYDEESGLMPSANPANSDSSFDVNRRRRARAIATARARARAAGLRWHAMVGRRVDEFEWFASLFDLLLHPHHVSLQAMQRLHHDQPEWLRRRAVNPALLGRILLYYHRYLDFHHEDTRKGLEPAGFWPLNSIKQTCLVTMQFTMQDRIGRRFVEATWRPTTKDAVNELVASVGAAFRTRMARNTWMDEETREKALYKFDMIKQDVGYPDIGNYSGLSLEADATFLANVIPSVQRFHKATLGQAFKKVNRSQWLPPPDGIVSTINAFYNQATNSINLPAGLIQYKMFNESFPAAYNFGSYGMVVGHEMTHGFDNDGREYNPTGTYEDWWSQASREAFDQRAQCFVAQYNQFSIGDGLSVDGKTTLPENIADNGGMGSAFDAMQAYLDANPSAKERDILTQFTDEQLFFIAYAQTWCEVYNTAYYVENSDDPHSPGFARTVGAVQNSEEFAKAFSCRAGDAMNPSNKCHLW